MINFIGFYDYTVILTYLSLISSIIGITQAIDGSFTPAVCCLIISGFCDLFDGTIARTKKNRTADEKVFGIQIDSLCDLVCFGAFPAILCYCMGINGIFGIFCICSYCLCGLIRLAFFNVIEANRQKTEYGCNKYYRGLPITSGSILFPFLYLFHNCMPTNYFIAALHIMLLLAAFLFVFDFKVKKFDISKIRR